jgi:hypothetical protein
MICHVFLSIWNEAQFALGWEQGTLRQKRLPTNFVSPIQKLPLYQ